MSDEHKYDHDDDGLEGEQSEQGWPEDIVVGQEGAVRVFWLQAEQMQGLVDRLALVLSEHMTSGDELHVTYIVLRGRLYDPTSRWAGQRRDRAARGTRRH